MYIKKILFNKNLYIIELLFIHLKKIPKTALKSLIQLCKHEITENT